jgi:hypothetical protein
MAATGALFKRYGELHIAMTISATHASDAIVRSISAFGESNAALQKECAFQASSPKNFQAGLSGSVLFFVRRRPGK